MLLYSLIKKRAKPIEEYSTLYPATSSLSASTRSKGARFYSAKQHTIQISAIGHKENKNQDASPCALTNALQLRLFAIIQADYTIKPIGNS